MSNMDYSYWNLNPLVLDKGEEVKEDYVSYKNNVSNEDN